MICKSIQTIFSSNYPLSKSTQIESQKCIPYKRRLFGISRQNIPICLNIKYQTSWVGRGLYPSSSVCTIDDVSHGNNHLKYEPG